jgi:WD40 repeat protein
MLKRKIAFCCRVGLLILSAVISACSSGFESAPLTLTPLPEPYEAPTPTPIPDTPQPTAAPTETAVPPSPTPEGVVAQFECGESNYDVAYSPDGSLIAVAGWASISICDPETHDILLTINPDSRTSGGISWSPDGNHLAAGSEDGKVRIWNAATGEQIRAFAISTRELWDVEWSPDGNWLAVADGDMHIWDVSAGNKYATFESRRGQYSVVEWSPDGSRIAGGSSYAFVDIWQLSTGDLSASLPYLYSLGRSVISITWSPDNQRLASGLGTLVTIYDTLTGQGLVTIMASPFEWEIPPENDLVAITNIQGEFIRGGYVAWSPDEEWLAGVDGPIIQVWEPTTGSEMFGYDAFEDYLYGIAWSPDGNQLATTIDGMVVLVDMSELH